jgi:hypothetical protein
MIDKRRRAIHNQRGRTMSTTAAKLQEYIAQANGFETH